MSYSPSPLNALIQRTRYLCIKNGVGLKGNAWNPCWRVWVELVQKMHLIWPPERVVFSLTLGMDERLGVGPATIVQTSVEIFYCDNNGQDTGSDTFLFEWFCPLVLSLNAQSHDQSWHTALGQTAEQQQVWLRSLLSETTLRKLSALGPVWKRSIEALNQDIMECSTEANG